MPDMALFAFVSGLVRRLDPEPWAAFRSNTAKAERFYRGLHRQDLETTLRTRFPEMYARGELVADLTPFARRIVDRAANLWNRPVTRIYSMGQSPLASDHPWVALLEAQEPWRKQALQDLDRLSFLCQAGLLRVEWNATRRGLQYWPINPTDAWIARSSSSDDLQEIDGLIYRLADRAGQKRFCLWTREWQLTYTGYAVDQCERIEEQADYRNPLGILPFVMAREESARGLFFPAYREDLVDVAEALSMAESSQEANIAFQSFGQPVVPQNTKLRRPIGRGAPLEEPLDAQGQTRYLEKHTPFEEISGELQRKLRTYALTRGLPPNDFAFDGKAPESGFAKLVDSMPLLELRQSRIDRVGVPVEMQLAFIEQAVLRYGLGASGLTASVSAEFAPLEFPRSDEEKARAEQAKREAQGKAIELNLTNPVRLLMEEAGLSFEEASGQVWENVQVNANVAAWSAPKAPVSP